MNMMTMTREEMKASLIMILVESGFIAQDTIDELEAERKGMKGVTLEQLLLDRGLVSEQTLYQAKSMLLAIPYCDTLRVQFDSEALKMITKEQAIKYCCIPFRYDQYNPNQIDFIMADPLDRLAMDDLQIITGKEIVPFLGSPKDIRSMIDEYYSDPAGSTPKVQSGLLNRDEAYEEEKSAVTYGNAVNANERAATYGNETQAPERETVREEAGKIMRYDVNEEWAHSGIIQAGNFYYLGYCVGNVGGTIEEQINGAFDHMERRLKMVGLTLENVIQMDCLFRDIWNIPVMEKVIKERFHGKYPVRKSIQTEFAHIGGPDGLLFQVDGVAYAEK